MSSAKTFSQIYKVGDNIQRALDKRNMTQTALAEELTKLSDEGKKYDKTHVNRWCNNRNVPSTSNMEKVADILGYSVEELVTGKFKDEVREGVDVSDPIFTKEIEQIMGYIDEICKRAAMDEEEKERYKNLIQNKTIALVRYLAR